MNILKNKIIDKSGIARAIILISLFLGSGYLVSHHQNAVEKRFGFCTMTPDMKWIPCHIEPIMIRCVTPGGAFDKAGFRDRDIVVLTGIHSIEGFHRLLNKPVGSIIEIDVISFNNFKPDCDPENWGVRVRGFVVAPAS
jgi:hypothetical protein